MGEGAFPYTKQLVKIPARCPTIHFNADTNWS